MPLLVPITDPFSLDEIANSWAYCAIFALDTSTKTGRIVYHIHKDKTSAYSGKPPIKVVQYEITPDGKSAEYGSPELVSPFIPATYEMITIREPGTNDENDPGEFEQVELTPAVPPVYSEAPLIKGAIPSFDELVTQQSTAYGLLLAAVDDFALTQTEFAGGTIEQ